jgi:hypothetical protein
VSILVVQSLLVVKHTKTIDGTVLKEEMAGRAGETPNIF